jgi:hypothetical protein
MHSLNEIRAMLQDSGELRQNIVRSLGSSTVALFAVFDDHGMDLLKLAGSGSFVIIDGSHFILTAAHVWEYIQSAVKMGITLTDNISHKHLIDIPTIVSTTVKPNASTGNEWGPDLALLRIPAENVGGIKAFLAFEDVKAPPRPLNVECLEAWVVMGTPGELGTFTQSHADVQIMGRFVEPQLQDHGEYDYFDCEMDSSSPGMPKSWGGVSGGGLWRVLVYDSPEAGQIDWAQRLKGVAFWESAIKNGYRVVRSHGPKSIAAMAGLVS